MSRRFLNEGERGKRSTKLDLNKKLFTVPLGDALREGYARGGVAALGEST